MYVMLIELAFIRIEYLKCDRGKPLVKFLQFFLMTLREKRLKGIYRTCVS